MAAVRANAWLPDFVLGVGRGGLAPAVFITHGLSVPMLSVAHSTNLAGFDDELLAKLAGLSREGPTLLFAAEFNECSPTDSGRATARDTVWPSVLNAAGPVRHK